MSVGKSELCIFNRAPPQIVVENYSFETIHPVNSIDNSNTIEFNILSSDSHYLDLNDTLIHVVGKVVDKDGVKLATTEDKIVPINYLLQNLFKDVILTLNTTQIEGGNGLYAQKAHIESILNYSKDTENVFLLPTGYYADDAKRKASIKESKKIVLTGPLHLDFFDQPKYLIPGVNVYLKLKINDDKYILKEESKFKINDIKLLVRRVRVSPSVLSGHQLGLNTQNAVYPIRKTRMLTFSLAKGNLQFYKDQIFGDTTLPKFILIAFQDTETLNGSFKKDASTFSTAKVANITLSRNTDYRDTYEMQWENDDTMLPYVQSIIRNMGYLNKNMNNGISYKDFTSKYPFFTFVLAPDFDLSQVQLPKQGNLRLDIKFKEGLADPTSVLVYGVFDSEVQISKSRAIFT